MCRRIGLYFNASVLTTLDDVRRRNKFQSSNVLNFQSVRLQTLAIHPIRSSHVIPQHETRSKKTMENTDERLICEVKQFNCLYNHTEHTWRNIHYLPTQVLALGDKNHLVPFDEQILVVCMISVTNDHLPGNT